MKEKHIVGNESKRILYSELEVYARGKIREHLQDLLEEVERMVGAGDKASASGVFSGTTRVSQRLRQDGGGSTMSLGTLEVRRRG